jgi:hypothetical protein
MGRRTILIGDTVYYAPRVDFLGNPRPHPIDTLVDMGAIESHYPARAQLISSRPNQQQSYTHPTQDSLHIGLKILNPGREDISLFTHMRNLQSMLWDEIELFDDGQHGDKAAGDHFYANTLAPVIMEYAFLFQHQLIYQDTWQKLTYQEGHRVTSVGPLVLEDYEMSDAGRDRFSLNLIVRNQGKTAEATAIMAEIIPTSNEIKQILNNDQYFGIIAPGESATNQNPYTIEIDTSVDHRYLSMDVIIKSNGYPYWREENLLVGIEATKQNLPRQFSLAQNYPNPFNPSTTINYKLATRTQVELIIYNSLGESIRTLANDHQPAGAHQVKWDGRNRSGKPVAGGVYFYRLKAGDNFIETNQMLLMR